MTARIDADHAINGRDEDRLQRSGFADGLAGTIASWSGDDSLVLAIYGRWGSGKTSLKNMVLETLGGKWPVVQFNPW